MTSVRPPVSAVQWHEGMLLAPQHFQQSSLRSEQLVHYHLFNAAPYHWGIRRLRIDPVALVNGTFRLTDLEAVMPDGLPVGIDADYPTSLELDLTAHALEFRRGPVTIHLCIPAERGDAPTSGALARFHSVAGSPVVDANTGEGSLRIPRLLPRLTLIPGETPPEKFVSFPIAEVRFQDETFALTDFFAPLLQTGPGSALHEGVATIAKRVREKASFLSEKVRASVMLEKRPLLQEMQATVRSLSAALPRLEAMVASGVVHPFDLYLGMAALSGHLSGLGPTQVPPVFPAYDHNDQRASFAPLFLFAHRMLDAVHESYTALPFAERDGRFSLRIPAERIASRLVVGLVTATGVSEADVAGWMETAQIGTAARMASIRDRRIRGAARERIEMADEMDLVPSRGVVLFAIAVDPDVIVPGEELVIVHPSDSEGRTRPSEITLYLHNVTTD